MGPRSAWVRRACGSARRLGPVSLRALASAARDLEAFALPQRCPGCGVPAAAERLLCDDCRGRVPAISFAVCARCLAREREPVGCPRHPAFTVWPALVYDERLALAVHAFKYGGRPGLAASLAGPIVRALPSALRPDLVTGVPLHPARRRERGYDQAWRLAAEVARGIGAPALEGVLERTRPTPAQARLDPERRRRNLAGAFRVPEWRAFRGRCILVVDDVMTTGATLEACLAALAATGARPVGAVLAWAQ